MPIEINVLIGEKIPEHLRRKKKVVAVFRNTDAPIFCTSQEEINTAVARLLEEEMKVFDELKPKSRHRDDDEPQP